MTQTEGDIEAVSATMASARLRRHRGYSYEHTLVERFNKLTYWEARRLGGSSTGLPDVVAVNNLESILLSIEAKSGAGDILYVPPDQLERCELITKMFSIYRERYIILAFKFMSKKRFTRKKQRVYENRELREYYKIADLDMIANPNGTLPTVKCNYDGTTEVIQTSAGSTYTVDMKLKDYDMPFKSKAIKKGYYHQKKLK